MDEGNGELGNLSDLEFENLRSDNDMSTSPQYLEPNDSDHREQINELELPNDGELLEIENTEIEATHNPTLQKDSSAFNEIEQGSDSHEATDAEDTYLENSPTQLEKTGDGHLMHTTDATIPNEEHSATSDKLDTTEIHKSSMLVSENELSDSDHLAGSIVDLLSDAEDEPREASVIELESEDEIENLEDEPISPEFPQSSKDTEYGENAAPGTDQELLDFEGVAGEDEDAFIDEEKAEALQISVFKESDDDLQEVSRSQFENIENFPTQECVDSGSQLTSNLEPYMQFPIFILVGGDTYLLAPCERKEGEEDSSLISLFTWDEVLECSISEFMLLLRQSDGLFAAYNFDPEDEISLRFYELDLTLTEDSIYAREQKLLDILILFYKLRENSQSDEGANRKLTLHVSMQKRFITQLQKLQALYREYGELKEVARITSGENNGLSPYIEDLGIKKKRRISDN